MYEASQNKTKTNLFLIFKEIIFAFFQVYSCIYCYKVLWDAHAYLFSVFSIRDTQFCLLLSALIKLFYNSYCVFKIATVISSLSQK